MDTRNQTVRDFLQHSLNDQHTSGILIGENHDLSPSYTALMANIDVLKNSNRQIIFVSEDLPQALNKNFNKILDKALKHPDKKLFKDINTLQENFRFLTLCRLLISNGIAILGSENIISNPFLGEEDNPELSQKMKAYAQSIERIKIPNEVFSDLILNYQNEKNFIIFLGGASHVPALYDLDNLKIENGMMGMLPNFRSLYLFEGEDNTVENFEYVNKEKGLVGNFELAIFTKETNLYKNTFSTLDETQSYNLLVTLLDNLFRSYLEFEKKSEYSMKEELENIVKAMNINREVPYDFTNLNTLVKEIINEKNTKHHPKFVSFFTDKNKFHYQIEKLHQALTIDLNKKLTLGKNN